MEVDGRPLVVEDGSGTRFWRSKAPATREAFKAGETVQVRLKTDVNPPRLREMADPETGRWLEGVRKGPVSGVVAKVDPKLITARFDDNSTFTYRVTAKTRIRLNGAEVPISSVMEGMRLTFRGRTLPSLDAWLASLTDEKSEGTKGRFLQSNDTDPDGLTPSRKHRTSRVAFPRRPRILPIGPQRGLEFHGVAGGRKHARTGADLVESGPRKWNCSRPKGHGSRVTVRLCKT
jgi:hypothetical protein